MAYIKIFVLAALFISNFGLSLGNIPTWEALAPYAQFCLSSSLTFTLAPYPDLPTNLVCSRSQLDAKAKGRSHCPDFCADAAWRATLVKCLNINVDEPTAQEVMLVTDQVICNAAVRDNIKFTLRANNDWIIQWSDSLDVTKAETVGKTVSIDRHENPTPELNRHALRDKIGEAFFQSVTHGSSHSLVWGNATTTSSCTSVATRISTQWVTHFSSSTDISPANSSVSSISCDCNSTTVIVTQATTTVTPVTLSVTASVLSSLASQPSSTSLASSTSTIINSTTITTHASSHTSGVHTSPTSSRPLQQTASGAAVLTGIDLESKLLLAVGGAGFLIGEFF